MAQSWHEKNLFWGTSGGCITFALAAAGFGVSGQATLAHWLFLAAWPIGAVACCCGCGHISSKRLRRLFSFAGCATLALALFAADRAATSKSTQQANQQRAQAMFASDRAKPLLDLYAVMALNRTYDPNELKDFCVLVSIKRLLGDGREQAVTLVAQSAYYSILPDQSPIPGMKLTNMSNPPAKTISEKFIYNYFGGLDRIELGVYQGDRDSGKIRTLDDLDGSYVTIAATKPLYNSIRRIIIVANGYVIVELDPSSVQWKESAPSDFMWLPESDRLAVNSKTVKSEALTSLSLSDVVTRRMSRRFDEIAPRGMAVFMDNLGLGPKPQHGWLFADSESEQWK